MTSSRSAYSLAALAFLWIACAHAEAQRANASPPSSKQELLSLNFTNNGQHLTATVGQRIEISLGTIGPKQYGDPQISSPAIQLDSVGIDWPPNPGGATHIYMFEAAAEGEAEVKVPVVNWDPVVTKEVAEKLTFTATIRVGPASGNLSRLHTSLRLDQANKAPWKNGCAVVYPTLRQTFTPSLPRVTGVEVELVVANPGPASGEINMMLLDPENRGLALVSKSVALSDCSHVLFFLPKGGARVTPGQVYTIELGSSDTVFGWKYVVGGYPSGVASFHDIPGKPLSQQTHNSFLFRTFGAN
jgi:hypothetical protein